MPTVYLVTGANRGIGLGLVTKLVTRPDTVVFAGTRDPSAAGDLNNLAEDRPNVLNIIKVTSGDDADNAAAVETIKRVAGRLDSDVVIANAGIASGFGTIFETPVSEMRTHWEVNVGGPIVLLQKTLPLLRASPRDASRHPKFIVISSFAGSIEFAGIMQGFGPYRSSKAALNFVTREIHFETETDGLVVFPLDPGPVETDMNAEAKIHLDVVAKGQANSVETCVTGLLAVIDESTRETHGGKFLNYNGEAIPW